MKTIIEMLDDALTQKTAREAKRNSDVFSALRGLIDKKGCKKYFLGKTLVQKIYLAK